MADQTPKTPVLNQQEVDALQTQGGFNSTPGHAALYSGYDKPQVEMRNGNVELVFHHDADGKPVIVNKNGTMQADYQRNGRDEVTDDRSADRTSAIRVDEVDPGIGGIKDKALNDRLSAYWVEGMHGNAVAYVNSTGATSTFRRVELNELMNNHNITTVTSREIVNGDEELQALHTLPKQEWYHQQRAQWANHFSKALGMEAHNYQHAVEAGNSNPMSAVNTYNTADAARELAAAYHNIRSIEDSKAPPYMEMQGEKSARDKMLHAFRALPGGPFRDDVINRVMQEFPEGDPDRARVMADLHVNGALAGISLSTPHATNSALPRNNNTPALTV